MRVKAHVGIERMKRIIASIIALLIVAHLTGCATVATRSGRKPLEIYPATKMDASYLSASVTDGEVYHGTMRGWERPLFLVGSVADLPFSLVIDTILVPVDFYYHCISNCY